MAEKIINALIIGLLLVSCSFRHEDNLINNIFSKIKAGDVISLSDFTDFEWDNVIITNPGTSYRDYQRFLGKIKKNDFDLKKAIIFRDGENVVRIIVINYHPEKYSKIEFMIQTNTYIILDRSKAKFNVAYNIDHFELSLIDFKGS